MIVRPPLEVLLVVGVVDRVIELLVDLWQRRVLGEVEAAVDGKQHRFEEAQPRLFHFLALDEHGRHVLHIDGVVFVDLLKRLLVFLGGLLYLVLGLLHAVLHLFDLRAGKDGGGIIYSST